MTSTTNHYDLIVLGADIAGLVAAALVARRGKRVLVIPHGSADGTYNLGREPYPLDNAPLVHLSCPSGQRVFEELGLWTQLRREHRPMREMLHWILPGHERLDVRSGMKGWAGEVERVWPDDHALEAWDLKRRWGQATDELLDEVLATDGALSADGFWGRRFLSKVADQLPNDTLDELEPLTDAHPLREAARAIEPWLQHLSPQQLGKAASLRLFSHWNRGPLDRAHGVAGLRKTLLQRIALKSGEVKPSLRVAELLIKRGKVIGLSLLGKRDRYGCESMIVSSDPTRLVEGPLTYEQLPRPLALTLDGIEPVAHRFVMHLEVEDRGLSPALEGSVVSLPTPRTSVDGEPEGWLGRHGAGLIYMRQWLDSPEGRVRLSITRMVGNDESLDDMRERVLEELDCRGVLPFVRPYATFVHSPHDGREVTTGEGEVAMAAAGGPTAMRLPMEPLYRSKTPPLLGVGLLPHSSGIRNLIFASRLTYPGLGIEGEFVAGWAAASVVAPPGRSGLGRNLFLGRG